MRKADKYLISKILIFLICGFLVTSLSASIARLGTAYKCDEPTQIEPYHRDERGIPLIFIERSIEDTGCGPTKMNGTKLDVTDNHRFLWLNFAFNIFFWALVIWCLISFKTMRRKIK
jgi:hypothetical protein